MGNKTYGPICSRGPFYSVTRERTKIEVSWKRRKEGKGPFVFSFRKSNTLLEEEDETLFLRCWQQILRALLRRYNRLPRKGKKERASSTGACILANSIGSHSFLCCMRSLTQPRAKVKTERTAHNKFLMHSRTFSQHRIKPRKSKHAERDDKKPTAKHASS